MNRHLNLFISKLYLNYIIPVTRPRIPSANNPKIIKIGLTLRFNNHIHANVNNKAAKPGINWSKLSCNVVTFSGVNEVPPANADKIFCNVEPSTVPSGN